jgi:ribose transport system substrate-binding protein
MKKKVWAMLCCVAMVAASLTGCGTKATTADATEGGDVKIALITMDSIDQHWITLNEGAQKAAEELGVTVTFMAPKHKG